MPEPDDQAADKILFDPDIKDPAFAEFPTRRPITAIIFSISGHPWIQSYIRARNHFGLTIDGNLTEPVLPKLQLDVISVEAVSSSTITKFLRRFFSDNEIRAHSLKHTLLSFAAKRGLDPSSRKLLGYHLDRSEVTLATYSRDLLAKPLRELHQLLNEIQQDIFMPDLTRSGYVNTDRAISSATATINLEVSDDCVKPETADITLIDDSSSDDSDSSLSSGNEADAMPLTPSCEQSCFSEYLQFLPVKHKTIHRLHLSKEPDSTRLICGRMITPNYQRLEKFPSHTLPTCIQCFGGRVVGDHA